uniref:Uncharacterized protein n=1 Tax=Palpitomonas bilix TaxID=652834 RepID=A0A7S3G536_9EUKA|mmetsp:Transcript_19710/g.50457  ORF Transcript_19710/g.50457 Transcript_19710/m.50457 type:complete len:229 (+) Transcript_19710:64-750(+)
MVKQALQLKANLENVTDLRVMENARYYVDLLCSQCGTNAEEVYFIPEEKDPIPNSRGEANYFQHCKFCKRQGSLNVLSKAKEGYTQNDSGNFKTVLTVECRGVEVTKYHVRVCPLPLLSLLSSSCLFDISYETPFQSLALDKRPPQVPLYPPHWPNTCTHFFASNLALSSYPHLPHAKVQSGYMLTCTNERETDMLDIDLSEGDWCDFDEVGDCSIGVYEVETRIEKA